MYLTDAEAYSLSTDLKRYPLLVLPRVALHVVYKRQVCLLRHVFDFIVVNFCVTSGRECVLFVIATLSQIESMF